MDSDTPLDLETSAGASRRSSLDDFLDRSRPWSARGIAFLVALTALVFSVYHLLMGYFAQPQAMTHRMVHVSLMLFLVFLVFPLRAKGRFTVAAARAVDGAVLAAVATVTVWVLHDVDAFLSKEWEPLSAFDVVMALVLMALVLEAVRRTDGIVLVLVVVFFLVHALFADHFPFIFYGPPTPWDGLLKIEVVLSMGIFGLPIMVMADYLTLYIILAVFLMRCGTGKFFIDIAMAMFGRQTGGPAKAAVMASGLFGTISGSSVANVVGVGTFTIPLMKKIGYRPYVAGAIEAVASSGGQIMPPVMGATAFVMAELIGVSYATVALAAAIPATLYYVSLLLMVHFEACKHDLRGLDRNAVPRVLHVLRHEGYLVVPLLVLVGLLANGSSVIRAGFWSVIAAFVVSFVRPSSRMEPRRLLGVLIDGAKLAVPVSTACAGAGIFIGAMTASGVGDRLSTLLINAAGGQLWFALFLTMIASFILGLGLTTTADYIILATLVVPALVQLGAPLMGAHMFAFYFSSISGITPPVAMAAFAAAGIAGASMQKTGWEACRIGIAAFLIPYMFVYAPELLLRGELLQVAFVSTTAILGTGALAAAFQGWLLTRATWLERGLLVGAALLLTRPTATTVPFGAGTLAVVIAVQLVRRRRARARAAGEFGALHESLVTDVKGATDHSH
ncbi:MAG: TRAP transporter fused permease subunit [Candidatus Rokubacteria bacterium]|nr:TRAP transporter fused permease subunit [Candidatus Rokubacteria bacterium]